MDNDDDDDDDDDCCSIVILFVILDFRARPSCEFTLNFLHPSQATTLYDDCCSSLHEENEREGFAISFLSMIDMYLLNKNDPL